MLLQVNMYVKQWKLVSCHILRVDLATWLRLPLQNAIMNCLFVC